MSSIDAKNASTVEWAQGEQDLGPLAWVLEELRKSLGGAVKSMRRFVRDAETARESDLAALDAGALRIARQQLHQASGALEMVGMAPPAVLLRAMEAAVQKFVQRPELCSDEAAATIERASFALIEFLESVLAGKPVSSVALFPQYREAQVLAGAERAHPADLWPVERRFREPDLEVEVVPLPYGAEARAQLDTAVLKIVKSGDLRAARSMRDTCLAFVAAQQERQPRAFWKICAGFFEAFSHKLLPADIYVKRVASRVLMQYATLAKGDTAITDRLVQDLLFFCSQARPTEEDAPLMPALMAVRKTFALDRFKPVDYEQARFGRFDPAVLAQARKRIAAATETWSALAGGDRNKIKPATDQFSLVCDSLRKLTPGSESLADALARVTDAATRSGEPPSPALAMEVATAVLYLQAAFEELDAANDHMVQRAGRLAERLDSVLAGKEPEALESWMEELYRRVSDNQTMGSVVDELRATLGEAEKALDQYFRVPQDTAPLVPVPGHMAQMRGVLSVLGLDQASLAVLRMRGTVEGLLAGHITEQDRPAVFERLGSSLGALGFLIDMLSYQPAMARKLFVYDEELGELRVLTAKTRARASDAQDETASKLVARASVPLPETSPRFPSAEPANEPTDFAPFLDLPGEASLAPQPQEMAPGISFAEAAQAPVPAPAPAPVVAAVPASTDAGDDEDDLLDIFLEEAREVVTNGLAALAVLKDDPADLGEQTTLRRAFHTLKGSSRMVGLDVFGEAAWSMEQVLNAWLAEQKPMPAPMQQLSSEALTAFSRWADDIAAGNAAHWDSTPFRAAADAMRLDGRFVALTPVDGQGTPAAPEVAEPAPAVAEAIAQSSQPDGISAFADDVPLPDFENTVINESMADEPGVPDAAAPAVAEDIDFSVFAEVVAADAAAAAATQTGALDFELPELDFASVPEVASAAPVAVSDALPELELNADEQELTALMAPSEVAPTLDASEIDLPVPAGDVAEASALTAEVLDFEEAVSPALGAEPLDEMELPPELSSQLEPASEPVASTPGTLETLDPFGDIPLESPVEELAVQLTETAPEESAGMLLEPSEEEGTEAAAVAGLEVDHALAIEPEAAAQDTSEPSLEAVPELLDSDVTDAQAPVSEPAPLEAVDETVKVIGTLRIGIPLYNVYLNEADEWSRRLVTSLQEWSLELHEPVPDTAVALAHSLAGSSATVGFLALSDMARTLEHALQHVQLQAHGTPEQSAVFLAAAEDIRRLLHQFAAGFLKEANPDILEALQQILATEIGSTLSPSAEFDELDDAPVMVTESSDTAPQAVAEPIGDIPGELAQALEEAEALAQAPVVSTAPVAPALSLVREAPAAAGATPVVSSVAHDVDDDIDALDVIDPDLFPIFEEEAAELLPQLGGALRQWVARPENGSARSSVLRALHTLKGSSRLAGAMRLGEMAHRLESAIEQLDAETVTTADLEPLQGSFDAIQAAFEGLRNAGAQGSSDNVVVLPVEDAVGGTVGMAPQDAAPQAVAQPVARPVATSAALAPLRVAASQSVRVRAQLLDRLINQAGEVMISRSRLDARMGQLRGSLADLSGNLDRLRQQLRDVEVQAETQMQSRLALSKDSAAGFDPLEFDRFTRVQELTRMMAESVNDVATVQRNLQRAMEGAEDDLIAQGRQARELQRDLLRTRMVEFEGIAERLYAVVRQGSKETGKQIKLDILGGSIEMDRGVLDRMTPAFEHLLRNCVVHGIEEAAARQAAGKSATGTITVDLRHEGNDVSVEFRDDGAGLNLPRIRAKALEQGLIAPDAELTDADAANLIFMPGFSTAEEVTGLAGRGIGMDVVRAEINALGGRIETSTKAGEGASFRMVLPLTTAVTQVVMLRAGDLALGVPANLVEIVRRTSAADLEEAYRTGLFDDGFEKLPFYWSGALLQASSRSNEPGAKTRPVVILRSAAQRIAMHVDEVLGNQEVVVKNLGPQLSRLPGLAGMSVLASGAVVLIYNPVALSTVYGEQVRATLAASAPQVDAAVPMEPLMPVVHQVPLILVVDDSITVRRVTQRLLQREGYRVALAADGLQALERLQEERPTVVLSDIEMPRMDGFDLARNIRSDAALRDLPIIMITSRIAEKHREHAMELGVNHYLGKPYSDEELLSLIRHYAALEASAVAG